MNDHPPSPEEESLWCSPLGAVEKGSSLCCSAWGEGRGKHVPFRPRGGELSGGAFQLLQALPQAWRVGTGGRVCAAAGTSPRWGLPGAAGHHLGYGQAPLSTGVSILSPQSIFIIHICMSEEELGSWGITWDESLGIGWILYSIYLNLRTREVLIGYAKQSLIYNNNNATRKNWFDQWWIFII